MEIRESWRLADFFGGDIGSPALQRHLDDVKQEAEACQAQLAAKSFPVDQLAALIARLNRASEQLQEAESFVMALGFLDTGNEPVQLTRGRAQQIRGSLDAALTRIDGLLVALPGQEWEALRDHPLTAGLSFAMEQRRRRAMDLQPEQEAAIRHLSGDGHLGWSDIYRIINARMRVEIDHGGAKQVLPLGQAAKLMRDSADRSLRLAAAVGLNAAYAQEAPLLASALNHLAGFRTAIYKLRGWRSVLKEPLANERMSEATLEAMWTAIAANQGPATAYLRRRAERMGADVLTTADLMAPDGADQRGATYPEVAAQVVRHFERFHPTMGEFARTAFAEGWVDTADGPARQPGVSMSIWFPVSRQSRVVMNHQQIASILAHELGHSYSYRVWYGTPVLSGFLALSNCLGEVPSTFAQLLVAKGMAAEATSRGEKLTALGELCGPTVVHQLLLRRGNFLFEKALYEARMDGPVPLEQINQLYAAAVEQATGGAIRPAHPYGWVSTVLFEMVDQPFYNFPYTVAMLLSAGLYGRFRAEGRAFTDSYDHVMADLGQMTVEEWAERHLGGNPATPEFWQRGIDVLMESIPEYLKLTDPAQ